MDYLLVLAHGAMGSLVRDTLVVLGAAAVISILLRRLRLSSVPGYLIVGAILGSLPASWHVVTSQANISQISDIAVILLMFTIGLHLDMESIKTGLVPIMIVGFFTTILCTLCLWPLVGLFGLSPPASLVVAFSLSMSSTGVAMGILQRNKETHLIHGRICIGVAIVEDLMSIPMLAMMPALALWAGVKATAVAADPSGAAAAVATDQTVWDTVFAGLRAIGGIIVMLAFAKYVLPRLLADASWGGNTEGLLVTSAGAGLAAAIVTMLLGFGPALGAFLAGFMLSSTPFRHQLVGQLAPMRDLFMAVFFTAVGIKLDVVAVLPYWWIILLGVMAVLVVKSMSLTFWTWAGGATAPVAALSGIILGQAGEFSLVIIDQAVGAGVIDSTVNSVMIGLVVVSLIVTTPVVEHGRKHVHKLSWIKPAGWFKTQALREAKHVHKPRSKPKKRSGEEGAAEELAAAVEEENPHHIIIAGFGVVGRNLAEHFSARGLDFAIVDLNAGTVLRQNELGRQTIYGDISNLDVLESAGLHHAQAVVITIPDDDMALRAVSTIRRARPDIFLAVRTSYLSRAIMAHEAGADHVTVEEVATAQDMAVKVIDQLERRKAAKPTVAAVPHL